MSEQTPTLSERPLPDENLDLVLERTVDISKEAIWDAWTQPDQLVQWFTPKPWQTVDCKIDLRPGGLFYTSMRGPEGQEFSGTGCYIEIVANEKLVWTNALLPGYRPVAPPAESNHSLVFTAVVTLESTPEGTKYTVTTIHPDEATRKRHEEMGFHQGWGAAFDQLVEMVKLR